MAAAANRQPGRTDTSRTFPPEELFHDPVFKRVEGNHSQTAFSVQKFNSTFQSLFQLFKLPVDGDPQRLKHQRGDGQFPRSRLAQCLIAQLDQISSRSEETFGPLFNNGTGQLGGRAQFTVFPEDPAQFLFGTEIEDPSGGHFGALIHPHIQRSLIPPGKSPFRLVDLGG